MEKIKYTREFGGTVVSSHNYKEILEAEGKEGVKFHMKHLKAYLKGYNVFTCGKNDNGDPKMHFVKQKLSIVE